MVLILMLPLKEILCSRHWRGIGSFHTNDVIKSHLLQKKLLFVPSSTNKAHLVYIIKMKYISWHNENNLKVSKVHRTRGGETGFTFLCQIHRLPVGQVSLPHPIIICLKEIQKNVHYSAPSRIQALCMTESWKVTDYLLFSYPFSKYRSPTVSVKNRTSYLLFI